ncbi:DUF6246 family protein [Lonsdalea quercina]|uniref:DUF6246 family protein n=1 Tax=Lonsdalea quercina TaxID=71657 RepID=UPI003974BCA7
MTPHKEIGECLITAGEDEYFFRPSFSAMSRIGEPEEIVRAYYDLHNDEITPLLQRGLNAYGFIPAWLLNHVNRREMTKPAIMAAMSVLDACCDRDPSKLIGEIIPGKTGKWAFVYRKGAMPVLEMVIVAQSLITHGIIGKAKVRQLQRHESNQATTEFRAFEYITSARIHLGLSREEAERLTMTEFQLMLAAKYPGPKGYTKEEYDEAADDYFANKAKRLAKAKKQRSG